MYRVSFLGYKGRRERASGAGNGTEKRRRRWKKTGVGGAGLADRQASERY